MSFLNAMSEAIHQTLLKSIENYQSNLQQLEHDLSQITPQLVLQLLRSRDTVEQHLSNYETDDSKATCARLLDIDQQLNALDERLRNHEQTIAEKLSLAYWRKRINAGENAWWWHFEIPKRIPVWNQLDWLWDFATLVVLALSASFIFSIYKALSVGEFTIVETFSTIAQVGGLAVVSQGALTQTGRDNVRKLLEKLNIPSKYHSELLLVFSLALLAVIYYSHQRLDQYYIDEGQRHYDAGQLASAEKAYLRALEIEPNNIALHSNLGEIYESMGNLDSALTHYSTSANAGDLKGINNMGRTLINRVNPVLMEPLPELAEAFLLLGLKHIEDNQSKERNDEEKDLHYQLARNTGWALLMQKKYHQAETMLKKAVELDESIPGDQTGGGMAYCFLADTYDHLGKHETAHTNWILCLNRARPETIIEYKWLVNKKHGALIGCIDTTRVITLTDNKLDKNSDKLDTNYVDLSCQQALQRQAVPPDTSDQPSIQ